MNESDIRNRIKELEAELVSATTEMDTKKLLINSSFGKLGSAYSILYAPDLMIQVTVTGQLSLLMLIEMMENKGLSVVSGNTDGIVIKCPKEKESLMNYIIKRWETLTGFSMEETKYAGIFSRDINNYIAVKPDGEVKLKGVFKPADIEKNPANEICSIAMVAYLKYGTPFEDTIRNCQDITKFVTIQHVNGGASKDGVFLGKSVRFYHAVNETGAIYDCGSNKKVDLTDGAKPIMDLSVPFPNDIDYQWYVNNCYDLFGK